jgi:predicted NAD/FAD-binding protein
VTLFEAGTRFGGHTHTVDVTQGGVTHGVDTGFLVFNERTYPQLIQLFEELGLITGRDATGLLAFPPRSAFHSFQHKRHGKHPCQSESSE